MGAFGEPWGALGTLGELPELCRSIKILLTFEQLLSSAFEELSSGTLGGCCGFTFEHFRLSIFRPRNFVNLRMRRGGGTQAYPYD